MLNRLHPIKYKTTQDTEKANQKWVSYDTVHKPVDACHIINYKNVQSVNCIEGSLASLYCEPSKVESALHDITFNVDLYEVN